MSTFDISKFIIFVNKQKPFYDKIIKKVNTTIDGRLCMSPWVHYLMAIYEYMPVCENYLETGVLWGGSIGLLLSLKNNDTKNIIGLDLFTGYYERQNHNSIAVDGTSILINEQNHLNFVKKNIELFNEQNTKVNLIKGSSYSPESVNSVKSITKEIDLIFLDGDHTTEGVTKDFLLYHSFLKKGGFMVCDNYTEHWWHGKGVKHAFDRIPLETYGFKEVAVIVTKHYVHGPVKCITYDELLKVNQDIWKPCCLILLKIK